MFVQTVLAEAVYCMLVMVQLLSCCYSAVHMLLIGCFDVVNKLFRCC